MVTFKNELKHWIFSSDKKDLSKDVMLYDSLKGKIEQAV